MAGKGDRDPPKVLPGQLELPLRPRAQAPAPPPVQRVAAKPPPRPVAQPIGKPVARPAGGSPARPFRVIKGEGQGRDETLRSRDDVARLLVAAAADMMLKRISVERADEIQRRVNRVMRLFDKVDQDPVVMALLRRELDDLEAIWREGQRKRKT
jgi:hypothetical protein